MKEVYTKQVIRKKKTKMKFSKKLLVWICLFLLIYIGITEWLFYVHGTEPNPILTGFVFGFCTIEIWRLAGIKIAEIKQGGTKDDSDRLEDEVDKP